MIYCIKNLMVQLKLLIKRYELGVFKHSSEIQVLCDVSSIFWDQFLQQRDGIHILVNN